MKKLTGIIGTLVLLFGLVPAFAAGPVALDLPVRSLLVSSSAIQFDAPFSSAELSAYPVRRGWERVVLLTVQVADVYVRFDGGDPSATEGHHIVAGSHMIWPAIMVSRARWIRADGDDARVVATEAVSRTGGL